MAPENGTHGDGSDAAPDTPKAKPSEKQLNLLAIIMQNVEEQPKVNWDQVASQGGLKNERVAKEMYRQMCKKFGWNNKGGGGGTASSATTTGGPPETPTKVTKRTGKIGGSGRKPRGGKKALAADEDSYESGTI